MAETPLKESGAPARQRLAIQDLLNSACWHEKGAAVTFAVVLLFSLSFLLVTITNPILDQHSFRQSQTAINIYYALSEGAFITPQNPVLGTPWSVPFEASVYQSVVAGLVWLTGLSIDAAGRIVSYLSLLGTVWVGALIMQVLFPRDRFVGLVFAVLMLASPIYLFWGRAVLIETSTVFLGTTWLYLAMRALRENSLGLAMAAAPLSVLTVLAKATTWPAFATALGLFWLAEWRSRAKPSLRITLVVGAGIGLTLLASVLWIGHSNEVKSVGLLTKQLTSSALTGWNYGQLSDRFSGRLWTDLLPSRMLPDIFGVAWIVLLVALTHLARKGRYLWPAIAAVALFFVPLALFTNLHLVHNYYQASNALFLIAAGAIALGGLAQQGHVRVAVGIGLAVLIAQFAHFGNVFWPAATQMTGNPFFPVHQAALFVKSVTPIDKALVAFGVDWNPVLHYYSERKGLAVPSWTPSAGTLEAMLNDRNHMGGLEIGSVVVCTPMQFDRRPDLQPIATNFIEATKQRAIRTEQFGRCTVYLLS